AWPCARAAPFASFSSSSSNSRTTMSDPAASARPAFDAVRIGLVSVSDRASSGVYEDQGIPALQAWLGRDVRNPVAYEPRLIPDDEQTIAVALTELVDAAHCD